MLQTTTKRLNQLELKLLESRHSYTIMLARLRNTQPSYTTQEEEATSAAASIVERGAGVGAEDPVAHILASQLPRPAIDFLERLHDSSTPVDVDSLDDSVLSLSNKIHFDYNPYDLTYLNDLQDVEEHLPASSSSLHRHGSDLSSSSSSSEDEAYIQDF